MVKEIAAMSADAMKTFCSGKRRASPTSEVAAASSQNKPSSQRHSAEIPSSSVTQATAKETRKAMNTGLCVLCAQGEGSCAAPLANTSVGAGLNSEFIADSIPREMNEIKQWGLWEYKSVYFRWRWPRVPWSIWHQFHSRQLKSGGANGMGTGVNR